MPTFDQRTEENIATLLPAARTVARQFIVAAQTYLDAHAPGVVVKIIDGNRTYAEQTKIYNQGRTTPGPIVTRAVAGSSWHNFGVAWDIGLFRGKEYLSESPLYRSLGTVGKAMGLDWGGAWVSSTDLPHYGLKLGITLAVARARHDAGTDLLAGTPYSANKTNPAPAPSPAAPATPAAPKDYPTWKVYLPGGATLIVEHSETDVVRAIAESMGGTLTVNSATKKIAVLKAP